MKIVALIGLLTCLLSISFASDKNSFVKRKPAQAFSVSPADLIGSSCKGLARNYDLTFSIVEKAKKGDVTVTVASGNSNKFEVIYNLDNSKATLTVLESMNSVLLVTVLPQGSNNLMYFLCSK